MDRLNRYRQLVKQYLSQYARLMEQQPVPELDTILSFDDDHGQYMLLKMGWPNERRARHTLLHVAVRRDKIWVEVDLTEESIASFLLENGVPSTDIVLAFQPPSLRSFTEFAVA